VEQYTRQGQELWSFSAGGGSTGHLLAAGGNAQVVFWDRRKGKVAAAWDEMHTEAVTQVRACVGVSALCSLLSTSAARAVVGVCRAAGEAAVS